MDCCRFPNKQSKFWCLMLIILDRDGVINQDSVDHIKSPEEWIPIPGSLEKIASLSQKGYQVVVATNQSGIALGYFDNRMLEAIHKKFRGELGKLGGHIDGIFFCPHHPDAGCECRKPRPGLLLKIAEHYQADLKKTWFVGDSLVDILAARAAGCQPVLVKTGNGLVTLNKLSNRDGILVFEDLAHVFFPEELLIRD